MSSRIIASLLLLVLGVLSPMNSTSVGQERGGKTWTILIKGFQFVPDQLEVNAGDTIVWKNEDIVPHTATAPKIFDSREIAKGHSWRYVAERKGTHHYICTYHPTMTAELTVR
jgi:plastocyanin